MQISANPISIIAAFFAGLLVSFSPCIYPFIPLTLSYIGLKGSSSRLKGLFLSLVYVAGISLTFSILGTIAALSGEVFGSFTQSPYFYLLIANIYILLALNLLEVIHFSFLDLSFLRSLAQKISQQKGSYLGILLLGLISGLLFSPCATPVLGAILTLIAKERSIFLGIILLSSFAFGMSFLLILTGTFSGFLYYLPKSGAWNDRLKKLGAFILLAGAEFFLLKAGFML